MLYDRQLVDDELYALWRRLVKASIRVLMISDSCHNGSVTREFLRDRWPRSAGGSQ